MTEEGIAELIENGAEFEDFALPSVYGFDLKDLNMETDMYKDQGK